MMGGGGLIWQWIHFLMSMEDHQTGALCSRTGRRRWRDRMCTWMEDDYQSESEETERETSGQCEWERCQKYPTLSFTRWNWQVPNTMVDQLSMSYSNLQHMSVHVISSTGIFLGGTIHVWLSEDCEKTIWPDEKWSENDCTSLKLFHYDVFSYSLRVQWHECFSTQRVIVVV